MMRIVLVLGLLAALAVGLIAKAPMRLVYDALAPIGIEAGLVQGTVWNGQALRVRVAGTDIYEVRTRLSPMSLLTGRPGVTLSVADPDIIMTGELGLGGEGVRVWNARGAASTSVLPGLSRFAFLNDAGVQFYDVSVSFDRDGHCLAAEGVATSAALADAGASYDVDLPILDMTLFCAGEDLALNLSGQGPVLDLEGVIRLNPREPRYRIVATPHDRAGGRVLALLGFEADGARWIADSDVQEEG